MVNSMRTHLHTVRQHLMQLRPRHLSFSAYPTTHNVEHGAEMMPEQNRISILIPIFLAIVKGQDDRFRGQWSAIVECIHQLVKGNRMIRLLRQVIHLLTEMLDGKVP